MKGKHSLPLIFTTVLFIALYQFTKTNDFSFSQFDVNSPSTKKEVKGHTRKPASLSHQGMPKKYPRKIDSTLAKYQKVKDLPSNLMALQSTDLLAQKFIPERKSALGQQSQLLLEVIPSHYYLDKNIDHKYSLKMRTLLKGKPKTVKLSIRDDQGDEYPLAIKGAGLYEMRIDAMNLKEGKTYFNIVATANDDEAFIALSLQAHEHYFDFIRSQDQGLNAEGDLFFSNIFHFYEKGNYLIEGTVYLDDKPYAQSSTLLKAVSGEVMATLEYHGLLFYRNKIEGRLSLKGVQVTKIDGSLNASADQYLELNQLAPRYQWEQFNSRPYFNEVVHNKINKLTQVSAQ